MVTSDWLRKLANKNRFESLDKFSIILANQPDDIPSDLFLRNPNLGNQFPRINCDQSDAEIKKRLKKWSTFPLEDGRVYIYIWGKPSVNFCMIKLHKIGISFYLVRVAFLLGVSMDERNGHRKRRLKFREKTSKNFKKISKKEFKKLKNSP